MTAEGSVYQRKDGHWVAQYADAKGKTRYLYRKTKAEARKALRDVLRDRDEGFAPANKLTVGMYLDEWMGERRNTVSYGTWRVQESMIRNQVKPHHGDSREVRSHRPGGAGALFGIHALDGLDAPEPRTVGQNTPTFSALRNGSGLVRRGR